MIKTYTPGDLATLALPALPGLLTRGCPLVGPYGPGAVFLAHADCNAAFVNLATDDGTEAVPLDKLALDLSDPAGRFRVACWLAEGERCKEHKREWRDCVPEDDAYPPGRQLVCVRCNESGYLRPPALLWWALSEPGPGTLPAWQSAAILHASALRVAAGMPPVADLWHGYDARRNEAWSAMDRMTMHVTPREWASGISTGHALLDDDVLTVELP